MSESRIHKCDYQSENVDVVCTDMFDENKPEWVLMVTRLADEADVEENHYLDSVGDIIWQTVVSINNCPFCGIVLSAVLPANIRLRHVDSSGWHNKVS